MEVPQTKIGAAPQATKGLRHVPRTPPYTPVRSKRRFERSDSPASISSIQPVETTSPAKKAAKRSADDDNVKVEELIEGDAGYMTDIDVVYPGELEEKTSSIGDHDISDDEGSESDTGISQRFQELGCEDREEAEFEKKRHESHIRRRTSSRLFKRSHSQSIKNESEVSDHEAMADHDLSSSARRLRRRVRGPSGIEIFDDMPRSSPEPRSAGLAAPFRLNKRMQTKDSSDSSSASDSDSGAMDVQWDLSYN